ncbi:MAG: LysR family transcriptional regulator [Rhodospirillaceae bacterium]|nr:LysR family transcriptional regulator [Rhodospirillaceae bacterium]
MLDLQNLRRFLAVAEHGNMTRASRALGIVQPALSRSIKLLEDDLGVTLFERTPHGITLTVYGKQLVPYARTIITDVKRATEELQATKGLLSGHVTFGVTANYADNVVLDAVLALHQKWPNLRVTIRAGLYEDVIDGILKAELDFGFGLLPPPHAGIEASGLQTEVLFSHRSSVIARRGHPLGDLRKVSLKDLGEYEWIILGPESAMDPYFRATFTKKRLPTPRKVIETHSIPLIKGILMNSDLVTILAPNAVAAEVQRGELIALRCPDAEVKSHSGFISSYRAFEPPAVIAIKEELRVQCQKFGSEFSLIKKG